MKVVAEAEGKRSGRYLNWDGQEIPW